ncbi:MAG: serine/threonine protein kinase [Verrucomicrobiaceae bacterium]
MSSDNDSQFPMALPNGFRMDHYEIKRTLGVGNFGVTYLAHSHRFNLPCVIKELLPGDFATRSTPTQEIVPLSTSLRDGFKHCQQDFLREATILHQVNHPNVVKILDLFNSNGTSYYVMPYARGITFEDFLMQRGVNLPMSEGELLEFVFPLLDGLESVHRLGYLHRDIKPENIIIVSETGQPVLIDFGAARQLIGSRSRPMSAILTRGYAPFEQYGSSHNQGPYTDVYALGAVLHRAITGTPPPEAIDRLGDSGDKYQPLAKRKELGAYSEKLRRAIDTALIPQAKQRPQTISDWRSLLPAAPIPQASPENQSSSIPPPLPQTLPLVDVPSNSQTSNWDVSRRPISKTKLALIALPTILVLWAVLYLVLSLLVR